MAVRRIIAAGGMLGAFALSVCVGGIVSGAALAAEGCPNEALRVEQGSTYLGGCRAYELVSPPSARPGLGQAATVGGAIAWTSTVPPSGPAGQVGSAEYLSRRSAAGWSTIGVTPPQSPETHTEFDCTPSMYFSPNLTKGVLSDGIGSVTLAGAGEEPCLNHNEPGLVSEPSGWQSEPEGKQNLFLADLGDSGPGTWRLVNRTPVSVMPADAWLEGGSSEEGDELSHVVFEEAAQLTTNAPVGADLYEWTDGEVRLVTFLPDGEPTVGQLANGPGPENTDKAAASGFTNAVSTDGSRVFFTAGGDLYVRLHADREPHEGSLDASECVQSPDACTIQVDASQGGGAGGGATFLTANKAGTKVFFVDSAGAELTSDTEPESGENVYEYEIATGSLRDLTGASAEVNTLGFSGFGEAADGSFHLYFVAEGRLAPGAIAGRPNLLAIDGGGDARAIEYIATLNAKDDRRDWGTSAQAESGGLTAIEFLSTRVSPDGRFLAFTSTEAPTIADYDNTPVMPSTCAEGVEHGTPSGRCEEIFLYEAGATKPACVSCNPGVLPAGPNFIESAAGLQNRRGPAYLTRNVTDAGSVFFNSPEALVPQDINGVTDVYEYDAGQLHLVSSGTSAEPSMFVDAGEDGADVFFTTSQRLLSDDANDSLALYDARRGGGFAEFQAPPECGSSGCRTISPPAPLGVATSTSAAFAGPGNLALPASAKPTTSEAKKLTRKQLRARALRACKHHTNKRKRTHCERQARLKYGTKALVRRFAKSPKRRSGSAR